MSLGEVHTFHGNSGSPVFVDLGGSHAGVFTPPGNYHMLGVVGGMYSEDADFQLEITTLLKGTTHGNNGIAMIVPANLLKTLLEDPRVQAIREAEVARQNASEGGKK